MKHAFIASFDVIHRTWIQFLINSDKNLQLIFPLKVLPFIFETKIGCNQSSNNSIWNHHNELKKKKKLLIVKMNYFIIIGHWSSKYPTLICLDSTIKKLSLQITRLYVCIKMWHHIWYEKLFEKDKYVKNMLILSNGVHCQNIPIWLQYDILIGNLTNTFH